MSAPNIDIVDISIKIPDEPTLTGKATIADIATGFTSAVVTPVVDQVVRRTEGEKIVIGKYIWFGQGSKTSKYLVDVRPCHQMIDENHVRTYEIDHPTNK